MKLRIFRIISLIIFILLCLLGFFFAALNIAYTQLGLREEDSYLILLISFLVGSLFLIFEIYFIIKSFRHGTLVLHQLCTDRGMYIRKKSTIIVSSIISLIFLLLLVFNLLAYFEIINLNISKMTGEFNIFYSLIILVNALEVTIYWLTVCKEDIEMVD